MFGLLLTKFGSTAVCPKTFFFFLPTWYEYLKSGADELGQCAPQFQAPNDIFPVGLAVLDMLLRLAGFIAFLSLLIAGIEYVVAAGSPEKITNARKRAINSLVGLAIAFTAALMVSFIGRRFG